MGTAEEEPWMGGNGRPADVDGRPLYLIYIQMTRPQKSTEEVECPKDGDVKAFCVFFSDDT